MQKRQFKNWLVLLSIWLMATGWGCAPKDPQTQDGATPQSCALQIVSPQPNAQLACGKILSTNDQMDLSVQLMNNHGITCKDLGDTVRITKLEISWKRDMKGGWIRESARGSVKYHNGDTIEKAITGDYANWVETLVRKPEYCPLGTSCDDECGCEELCCIEGDCCLLEDLPCHAKTFTKGVIIAVVSGMPLK